MHRIDQSAERTRRAVREAFEAVGINGDHSGDSRIDGVVFDGDPSSGPSKWVIVDLGESGVEPGVTLLSVTVRDFEGGDPRGRVDPDSPLRQEVLEAIQAASGAELVAVDPVGDGDGDREGGEPGATRWERR